jgi:uncharacterized protein (TIGR02598 family)
MNLRKAQLSKRCTQGFNLIEVTVALAVISFSCTCLLGLLPASMSAYHQAMGNTVEAEIVQSISNDLALDKFSTLAAYAATPTTIPTYYYDNEGGGLPSTAGHFYQATFILTQITSLNSPANIDPVSGSIGAYIVTVSISNTAMGTSTPHTYTFVLANNGQQ